MGAVSDFTFDDAEDCLRLLAVLMNRGQGGLPWPKRNLPRALIRGARARLRKAASIAAHTARAQAKNSPSPAIAGMGSVRVVKRWGRWDSSPPRFCCAQFCAFTR